MSEFGSNIGYVDELYARFLANPASVSEAWREFFAGLLQHAPRFCVGFHPSLTSPAPEQVALGAKAGKAGKIAATAPTASP